MRWSALLRRASERERRVDELERRLAECERWLPVVMKQMEANLGHVQILMGEIAKTREELRTLLGGQNGPA